MSADTDRVIAEMLYAYNERRFSDFAASYTDNAVMLLGPVSPVQDSARNSCHSSGTPFRV